MTRLIRVDQCRPGQGAFVEKNGRELAVFQPAGSGRFAVIDNACPHASGNLAGGTLEGNIVTCPWHDWPFDVTTGVCTRSPSAKVNCYPTEVRDGYVWCDLDAPK